MTQYLSQSKMSVVTDGIFRLRSVSREELKTRIRRKLQDDFIEYSTLHGINDLYRAKGCPLKVIWSVIFVTALGAAFYGCFAIVNAYVRSPVVVSYFVYGNESLKLPDIIVCPLNRFNKTYLVEHNLSDNLAQYLELSFPSPMIFPAQRLKFTEIYKNMEVYEEEFNAFLDEMNQTFTEFIEKATDFDCNALIAEHNIEKINEHGDKIGRMSCTEFPTFRISSGKCVRLPGQNQEAAGYGYGTRVTVTLPRQFFSPAVNQLPINGLVVKLATSDGFIDKSDLMKSAQGLDTNLAFIPAGVYALISLKATRYEFINDPPRYECLTETGEAYSRVNCFDSCVTKPAEEKCGCSPAASATPRKPICSAFQYWNCFFYEIIPIMYKRNNTRMNYCRKKCKPLCSYWQYTPTISYGTFPSPEFRTFVPDNDTWEQLHNNIILEIFYEHLEYTTIKHFSSMAPDSFIAQLGGQISLWVGGSILTVVQLLVFLLQFLCSRVKEMGERKTDDGAKSRLANGHLSHFSKSGNEMSGIVQPQQSYNSSEALV